MSEQELTPSSGSAATESTPAASAVGRPLAARVGRLRPWLADLLPTLWRWLCRPWWKWVMLACALLLAAAALWLPQLPANLVDNSTLATRWLNRTSGDFAWGGEVLRVLGLFDVVHSLLLRVVLIVAGLISAVQLADSIGFARTLFHIEPAPQTPVAAPGDAIALQGSVPLYRLRTLHPFSVNDSAAHVDTFIREHYANFTHTTYTHTTYTHVTDSLPGNSTDEEPPAAPLIEQRALARHDERAALLRPFWLLGQLLLIIFVGVVTIYGWSFTVLGLGPGEESAYNTHQLEMRYVLPPAVETVATADAADASLQPQTELEVRVGDSSAKIDTSRSGFAQVGGVYVRVRTGDPGLLVRTVGESPLLMVPGGGARSSHVGLVFPDVGSEAFVVLPLQAIALRILRATDDAQTYFLVEVFDDFESTTGENVSPSDMQPSDRIAVYDRQRMELTADAVVVEFLAMPGFNVRAISLPGVWLFGAALVCLLIGATSLRQRPSFLLTQVVPWLDRSVVIAQSSARSERDRFEAWLTAQQQNGSRQQEDDGTGEDAVVSEEAVVGQETVAPEKENA